MECPKCQAAMEAVTVGGIEVERCTSCMGLWFEGGDLPRLKEMKGSETIDTGSATVGRKENLIDRIMCPSCHSPMIRMVDIDQHHIWFESCKVCKGVFLDAG